MSPLLDARDVMVSLRTVARELGTTTKKLERLEEAGQFPPILRLDARTLRVNLHDYREYKAGRWTAALVQVREAAKLGLREMPPVRGRKGR